MADLIHVVNDETGSEADMTEAQLGVFSHRGWRRADESVASGEVVAIEAPDTETADAEVPGVDAVDEAPTDEPTSQPPDDDPGPAQRGRSKPRSS